MGEPTDGDRWLLPEGVDEVLPPRARALERLRRALLDLFHLAGFELVDPPLLEFVDSLTVAGGAELDLQTFKVVDQYTGRMMGLRPDITAQVARIDARSLQQPGPARLCYAGPVFRARPEGLFPFRTPERVGAELYGVPGPEGDAEVLALMGAVLEAVDAGPVVLELGHVGLCRALLEAAALPEDRERAVFDALQRKATADLDSLLASVEDPWASALKLLPKLYGDASVLKTAEQILAPLHPALGKALEELRAISSALAERTPGLQVTFDLAELHGYAYHTGAVFSAYAGQQGSAVARGGRYDSIGGAFGRARPATGFDADLAALLALAPEGASPPGEVPVIADPASAPSAEARAALPGAVASLRAEGVRVVMGPGAGSARLQWNGSTWTLTPLALEEE